MKIRHTYLFLVFSSIALVGVLIIQITWILKSAELKEDLFNEKAQLVLSKTADKIVERNKQTQGNNTGAKRYTAKQVDSILKLNMSLYNINLTYSLNFRMENIPALSSPYTVSQNQGTYQACMPAAGGQVANELNLYFPEREEYIMEEMGVPFLTSLLLVILVLITFWKTTMHLLHEKKIAEMTTDFLNNMTHEFKTPLTNISLAGKMLQKENAARDTEKLNHYAEIILNENDKLKQQVEQVLSMSALERGEMPFFKRECDLHEIIRAALQNMDIQLQARKANVKAALDAENFLVVADPQHLTNVFINLIDNALKYSEKDLQLTIETGNEHDFICVMVKDNGIGMEKKFADHVFAKYYRVPTGAVHDVKGFGLGLSYVKKIIGLLKGEIFLFTQKNEGTTFKILIPHAGGAI